jgi:hypothetical protein
MTLWGPRKLLALSPIPSDMLMVHPKDMLMVHAYAMRDSFHGPRYYSTILPRSDSWRGYANGLEFSVFAGPLGGTLIEELLFIL